DVAFGVMSEDFPKTLLELERRFSCEDACAEYLAALRWPGGWVCPRCAGTDAWSVRRNRWLCGYCRYEMSVTAGTVFQDSHLPLTIWFRAMWQITSQKNGISALGLQRVLGLGSYKTAWAMLHKLRRAMVRPGRERLDGVVEVDETYWGGEETGAIGRRTEIKAMIIVAAQEDGKGIGRIRLRSIPNLTKATLHGFIAQAITPGSTVRTDGLPPDAAPSSGGGAFASASSPRDLSTEAMVARYSSGRDRTGSSERLPRRVHLSIQPPHFYLSGQAVLSSGPTGRAGWAGPLRDPGQTTTCCAWWRQVNIHNRKCSVDPAVA